MRPVRRRASRCRPQTALGRPGVIGRARGTSDASGGCPWCPKSLGARNTAIGKMMKTAFGLTGLVLAAGLSMPAMAQQIDAGMLTCETYLAMDAAGKAEATNAVTSYVNDAANASTTAAAAEVITGMDEVAVQQALDAACAGAAAGTTVPMALQAK